METGNIVVVIGRFAIFFAGLFEGRSYAPQKRGFFMADAGYPTSQTGYFMLQNCDRYPIKIDNSNLKTYNVRDKLI